jgi:AraC family transcriptional activator of pobA
VAQVAKETVDFTDPGIPVKAYITNFVGTVNPHIHSEIEWIYVLSGAVSVQVMDEPLILQKGDITVINSYFVHSTINDNPDSYYCLLQFNPEVLIHNSLASEYKYAIPFICQDRFRYKIIHPGEVQRHQEISTLLTNTANEFQRKAAGYEVMIKSNIYKLVALLYRYNLITYEKLQESHRDAAMKARLAKVVEYLETHYEESIDVSVGARLAGLHPDYFCRLFKTVIGKSFIQYLNAVRVSVAEKLLLTTNRQITDILVETGFSSLSYFNRTFKKIKKCCPSEYRRQFGMFPAATGPDPVQEMLLSRIKVVSEGAPVVWS